MVLVSLEFRNSIMLVADKFLKLKHQTSFNNMFNKETESVDILGGNKGKKKHIRDIYRFIYIYKNKINETIKAIFRNVKITK